MIRSTFALLGDVVGLVALLLIVGGVLVMAHVVAVECVNCGAF